MVVHRYFVLNKPYNIVSQFISSHEVRLLGDVAFNFPEGTHAIGRLDNQSEGLLLLTTNKKVTRLLFQGERAHSRTYLVQVKNRVSDENVELLRSGIPISAKNGQVFVTTPCKVEKVDTPENLFSSGYELREGVQNTWLLISLIEGKFHQVRKMVAAIHHPCKRLIRVSIENISLGDLQPGEVKEMDEKAFFEKLGIHYEN